MSLSRTHTGMLSPSDNRDSRLISENTRAYPNYVDPRLPPPEWHALYYGSKYVTSLVTFLPMLRGHEFRQPRTPRTNQDGCRPSECFQMAAVYVSQRIHNVRPGPLTSIIARFTCPLFSFRRAMNICIRSNRMSFDHAVVSFTGSLLRNDRGRTTYSFCIPS